MNLYCDNYIGDSNNHLYISCIKKGIVTALMCMICESRHNSNVRIITESKVKKEVKEQWQQEQSTKKEAEEATTQPRE